MIFDAVKEGTVATVSYNFPRPNSNDPVPKESSATAVGTQARGVGYYKIDRFQTHDLAARRT
jgi:hypothetical protein